MKSNQDPTELAPKPQTWPYGGASGNVLINGGPALRPNLSCSSESINTVQIPWTEAACRGLVPQFSASVSRYSSVELMHNPKVQQAAARGRSTRASRWRRDGPRARKNPKCSLVSTSKTWIFVPHHPLTVSHKVQLRGLPLPTNPQLGHLLRVIHPFTITVTVPPSRDATASSCISHSRAQDSRVRVDLRSRQATEGASNPPSVAHTIAPLPHHGVQVTRTPGHRLGQVEDSLDQLGMVVVGGDSQRQAARPLCNQTTLGSVMAFCTGETGLGWLRGKPTVGMSSNRKSDLEEPPSLPASLDPSFYSFPPPEAPCSLPTLIFGDSALGHLVAVALFSPPPPFTAASV
ncbi:hypothetical protein FDECE_14721 [Fusarium decemcellulare]|nr:hypothetical protein FDECE_14721 [Fusarium decemcellulare]